VVVVVVMSANDGVGSDVIMNTLDRMVDAAMKEPTICRTTTSVDDVLGFVVVVVVGGGEG
jgi:hypothetical protein